jgi:hypothetical protein
MAHIRCAFLDCPNKTNKKTKPKKHAKNRKCSGCRLVYYCGIDCQRADWAEHKIDCKKHLILPAKLKLDEKNSAKFSQKTNMWVRQELARHNRILANGRLHCSLCGDQQTALRRLKGIGVFCTTCIQTQCRGVGKETPLKSSEEFENIKVRVTLHNFDRAKEHEIGCKPDSNNRGLTREWLADNMIYLLRNFEEVDQDLAEEQGPHRQEWRNRKTIMMYRSAHTYRHLMESVMEMNQHGLTDEVLQHVQAAFANDDLMPELGRRYLAAWAQDPSKHPF